MKSALLASLIFATPCLAMDDLTIAGVYAIDRNLCSLSVPQREIDVALLSGALQYDIPPSEAVRIAVERGAALKQQVIESGRVAEYCDRRRMK